MYFSTLAISSSVNRAVAGRSWLCVTVMLLDDSTPMRSMSVYGSVSCSVCLSVSVSVVWSVRLWVIVSVLQTVLAGFGSVLLLSLAPLIWGSTSCVRSDFIPAFSAARAATVACAAAFAAMSPSALSSVLVSLVRCLSSRRGLPIARRP